MAAMFTVRSAVLAAFVITGVLISGKYKVEGGLICKGGPKVLAQCTMYIIKHVPKVPPSHKCCIAVKAADIPCLCEHVTEKMEEKLDMEKVAYVAEHCGKRLAHGSTCGSYTAPPAV